MLIEEYVRDLLDMGLDRATALESLRSVPMLFAATYRLQNGIPHWCFLLDEEMRRHPFVLGIGVTITNELPIDKLFYIPSTNFGVGGSFVLSEKDDDFSRLQLNEEQFRTRILSKAAPGPVG